MSIARILSLFRPTKASVEPVSRTDDPGVFPTTGWGEHADLVSRPAAPEGWKDPRQAQHPLAPEKDPPPLDWDRWSTMARDNQRRGWSFARFAACGPNGYMACLFGIVRGPFGIAKMDFYICATGRFDILHSITHLPSGMGCGLFTDQQSAANACEIAARLADDWEVIEPHQDAARTREAILHMHAAWTAAGIIKCETHAHVTADTSSAPLTIWFQDYSTVVAGRPEGKLS